MIASRLSLLTALCAVALPTAASAADHDLFRIRKAILPQNEIMVQASVDSACRVKGLNFNYHVDVDPKTGQAREVRRLKPMAERKLRERFRISAANRANAAACKEGEKDCSSIAVAAEEFNWVQHGLRDSSVIVKARKLNGACQVTSSLEVGDQATPFQAVRVNAENISYGLFGASFRVVSLVVYPVGGNPITWKCTRECEKREGL